MPNDYLPRITPAGRRYIARQLEERTKFGPCDPDSGLVRAYAQAAEDWCDGQATTDVQLEVLCHYTLSGHTELIDVPHEFVDWEPIETD